MSKHTPGPWAIDWDISRLSVYELNDGKLIASLRRPDFLDDQEIAIANSRLIASAPILLECLEKMCRRMLERGVAVNDKHPDRIALRNAELAIKKARGEK